MGDQRQGSALQSEHPIHGRNVHLTGSLLDVPLHLTQPLRVRALPVDRDGEGTGEVQEVQPAQAIQPDKPPADQQQEQQKTSAVQTP